jgi:predicted Zn-dependent protease
MSRGAVARFSAQLCRNQLSHLRPLTLASLRMAKREKSIAASRPLDNDRPWDEHALMVSNNLASALATCPDPSLRKPSRAVTVAQAVVREAPRNGLFWNTLGAAQCRAGDWAAAHAALERSVELRSGGDSFDWFFLAMACAQRGQVAQAGTPGSTGPCGGWRRTSRGNRS